MSKKRNHKTYHIETVYLGEHIDLKKVETHNKGYKALNHDHPLALQLDRDGYAVLTKFGTIP